MHFKDVDLVEETISSEEIYNGVIVHLFRDTVRLPNGNVVTREVVRHPGAAAVVPVTEDGNVILVRQYRYPFAEVMLEIPAGKLDANEAPADCARRELLEETGYEAAELVSLGVYYPSVAVMDEKISSLFGKGVKISRGESRRGRVFARGAAPAWRTGRVDSAWRCAGRQDADRGVKGMASRANIRQIARCSNGVCRQETQKGASGLSFVIWMVGEIPPRLPPEGSRNTFRRTSLS